MTSWGMRIKIKRQLIGERERDLIRELLISRGMSIIKKKHVIGERES
jgi:hypothetical protein